MEPSLTERDVALLLLDEDSLVTLGAVLALRAKMPSEDPPPAGLPQAMASA